MIFVFRRVNIVHQTRNKSNRFLPAWLALASGEITSVHAPSLLSIDSVFFSCGSTPSRIAQIDISIPVMILILLVLDLRFWSRRIWFCNTDALSDRQRAIAPLAVKSMICFHSLHDGAKPPCMLYSGFRRRGEYRMSNWTALNLLKVRAIGGGQQACAKCSCCKPRSWSRDICTGVFRCKQM